MLCESIWRGKSASWSNLPPHAKSHVGVGGVNNVPACLKVVLLFNFLSVGCIYWFVFWNTVKCNSVVFTCFVIWRFGKQNFYLRMFNVILLREWHSVSAFLAQTLCNCWPHLLLWDLFFQFWQFHEIVILQISLIWFEI